MLETFNVHNLPLAATLKARWPNIMAKLLHLSEYVHAPVACLHAAFLSIRLGVGAHLAETM